MTHFHDEIFNNSNIYENNGYYHNVKSDVFLREERDNAEETLTKCLFLWGWVLENV